MPKPNQLPKIQFEGIDPVHQQFLNQLTDTVNTLAGYNGQIVLNDHLDMGGKRVTNIGEPILPTDAISTGRASRSYSASALRPQLESNGAFPLQTTRRINDRNQREQGSSFLNDLMSSVPSASQVFPTVTPSGGGVSVSIPSSLFVFADDTSTQLNGRTDLLSLPAQYAITGITLTGSVETITTSVASGLVAGQIATVIGVDPASFNGVFQLIGATPPFTLVVDNPAASGMYVTGGFVQTSNVYYYGVQKRSQNLILFGPFSSDTASNRLEVNGDGFQIVAVITLTNSGAQVASSGGGGTPIIGSPTGGCFF